MTAMKGFWVFYIFLGIAFFIALAWVPANTVEQVTVSAVICSLPGFSWCASMYG